MSNLPIEIDFNHMQIKEMTPYLDDIKVSYGKYSRGLTIRQRAFCWYCVWGDNKLSAFEKAYGRKIKKNSTNVVYIESDKPHIKEAIKRIRENVQRQIKESLPSQLCEQLVIQAMYDPSMFFNPDGSVAFKNWNEIPKKYRCCVQGIKTKAYGKDGDTIITTIELADREVARKYLIKMFPGLVGPDKIDVVHRTVDKDGNEVGIDFSKASDEELERRIIELRRIRDGRYEL